MSEDKAINRTRLRDDQDVKTIRDLKITMINMLRNLMEKVDNKYAQMGILRRNSEIIIM